MKTNALHSCLPFRYENGAIWSYSNGYPDRVCVAVPASEDPRPARVWERDANMRLLARAVQFVQQASTGAFGAVAQGRAEWILSRTGELDS